MGKAANIDDWLATLGPQKAAPSTAASVDDWLAALAPAQQATGRPEEPGLYESVKNLALAPFAVDKATGNASLEGGQSAFRGAAQGASLGFGDELAGMGGALAQKAYYALHPGTPQELRDIPLAELYRQNREEARADDRAAEEANPKTFLAGQVAGSALPAMLGGAPASLRGAAAAGAELGAAAGLGGSSADLTRGDISGAVKDTALGAGLGAAGGIGGYGVAKAAGGASSWLREAGRGRLFKAAVGQNKNAFMQMNGRGLLGKAGAYLEDMGIGTGDSTASISRKLGARRDELSSALDQMVTSLDAAGAPKISASYVADQIEKRVAAPLKRIAANQDEYAQVMREVEAIRGLGDEGISFAEAATQRRAVQGKINYDKRNGLDAAAEAKNKIAQIWNDVIDDGAEPILKASGKAGDAYRELRHEYGLVNELLDHSKSSVAGNARNRWASPSDYGAGAIGTLVGGGNPVLGLAAATANHLARIYGNAAAGRAAIRMARAGAMSPGALKILPPALLRALYAESRDQAESPPGPSTPPSEYQLAGAQR